MDISTKNSRILSQALDFPKKSTKNSSFFQKWRNLSYNKTNKLKENIMESKHYGKIIYKIRQDRNMSLKEAAGDAITPNNLSRFEKGLATVKVDTFFEILSRFNLDLEDYVELLNIQDESDQRIQQVANAVSKNDMTKAKQILGGKSEWKNVIEYYTLKLCTTNPEKKLDDFTPDELEAIHYLIDYILSIDTLYIRDFAIVSAILDFEVQCFEVQFLEYLESLIVKGLEEVKYRTVEFSRTYFRSGITLARTYSRYGYYDKAEKLIYKLKIILTQEAYSNIAITPLFWLNMHEVYNLLRQNNYKAIERANSLLHYIDAQNDLFPLPYMFTWKNTFIQEVQRLNKTGIPFPTEDE